MTRKLDIQTIDTRPKVDPELSQIMAESSKLVARMVARGLMSYRSQPPAETLHPSDSTTPAVPAAVPARSSGSGAEPKPKAFRGRRAPLLAKGYRPPTSATFAGKPITA